MFHKILHNKLTGHNIFNNERHDIATNKGESLTVHTIEWQFYGHSNYVWLIFITIWKQ